jgi:AraC-like DNA-binding protein
LGAPGLHKASPASLTGTLPRADPSSTEPTGCVRPKATSGPSRGNHLSRRRQYISKNGEEEKVLICEDPYPAEMAIQQCDRTSSVLLFVSEILNLFPSIFEDLTFQPFSIDHRIDPRKDELSPVPAPQFPFAITLFSYDQVEFPLPPTCHEDLEIFVPTAGEGVFAMGEARVAFFPGDVLIIDSMKLHGVVEFKGPIRRAVIIRFLPHFVFSLGSSSIDAVFLSPFYCLKTGMVPVVRGTDRLAGTLYGALVRLVSCYYTSTGGAHFQAGCKAYLLQFLYLLAGRFAQTIESRDVQLVSEQQARLLCRLHDYLRAHYAEKVSVSTVASLANMSESRFMRYFKRVTGETFVAYLTRLRVERAAQLLEETDLSIAQVANAVGFSDQSHFDRVFRRHFKATPSEARRKRASLRLAADLRSRD